MNDTAPEIAKLVRQRLMERSGFERVLMGSRMFDTAKAIVLASFPEGLTDIEIKGCLCERLYGNEVDVRAFVEHLRSLPPQLASETETKAQKSSPFWRPRIPICPTRKLHIFERSNLLDSLDPDVGPKGA
jgi:hypothetical protein